MNPLYRFLTIAALFGYIIFFQACSTPATIPTTEAFSPGELFKADIEYLASDELEGRETGTQGELLAAAYISDRFEAIGLDPGGDMGTFYQKFEGNQLPHPHARPEEGETIEGVNVIGFIDHEAEYTVVIGAHYDHLGWGGHGSLHRGDSAIHPGADDNASGVAMILYLADRLKNAHTATNYIFIAFSGEEKGLWGSGYWTKNPTVVSSMDEISYMLNFDMVGRLDEDRNLMINGTGTSPIWERRLERANRANLNLAFSQSGIGGSDHTSFYLKEIPAIHFFTGLHDDYHRPADTPDKINYNGILEIGSMAFNLIGELQGDGKLIFSETVQEDSRSAPRYTVSLGVLPDYMYSGGGLKLEGVTTDRPAEKAGLQRGDIITRLGDFKIETIYDYMEALSDFKSGDKAEIEYKRDGENNTATVQF